METTTVTRPPDIKFKPGDRFLLPAGNGRVVRTGSIIEWAPPIGLVGRGQWFIEVDPEPTLPGGEGYKTWMPPDRLLPTSATAEEIAAYVAARQAEWFGPRKLQRAAAKLVVGDRIAAGFLPRSDAANVVFVLPYTSHGDDWVFVAYQHDDGLPDRDDFRAAGLIPLEASGDTSGLGYGRAAGAGEAVVGAVPPDVDGHAQGGRVAQAETGGVPDETRHPAESSFAPFATTKDTPDPMFPKGELADETPAELVHFQFVIGDTACGILPVRAADVVGTTVTEDVTCGPCRDVLIPAMAEDVE